LPETRISPARSLAADLSTTSVYVRSIRNVMSKHDCLVFCPATLAARRVDEARRSGAFHTLKPTLENSRIER
jgi:hypothetical protein